MILLAFIAGEGMTYGGRMAMVNDKATGRTVQSFREGWITNGTSDFTLMIECFRNGSLEHFESVWLASPQPAEAAGVDLPHDRLPDGSAERPR